MTQGEAIGIAKFVAQNEGWSWKDPARATKHRRWFFGSVYWEIISNVDMIGSNVRIKIEDATGKVLEKGYLPR